MNNDEGGTDDEEFRVAAVIDRVNTSFDVWQSTTMSCVRCHGHPYDPIKHDEYYKIMAFLIIQWMKICLMTPNLKDYTKDDQRELENILNWIKSNGDEKLLKYLKFYSVPGTEISCS